jgi:SAM-dependent methyltransferase
MNTASEYDVFAADYHWLYSDRVLSGEPFLEAHTEILKALPPKAQILDCACGIGIHGLALARRGCCVRGTDASTGMVAEAQRRAADERLAVEFTACAWSDLSMTFQQGFDLVFCTGNAIPHCRNSEDRFASLCSMHAVLNPGGSLVLDSRNWEKVRRERIRFHPMSVRVRNGERCLPLYVWHYPRRWHAAHVIELVLLFTSDQDTDFRCYRVTYYPFHHEELIRCLKETGFKKVYSDFDEANDWYTVTAIKG